MAGRFDEWKAREPDPCGDGPLDHLQSIYCRDCGAVIYVGGVTTGVASGPSCVVCYVWRVDHDAVFDPRTVPQIQAGQRKDVA